MTTAKSVQVSDDAGVIWHTLPGGSGEWNDDADQIDDTIFGQSYQSNEVGLITWNASANALYKGFAGYQAVVKKVGITTVMTAEAMSVVSGLTYEIDDVTKEVWDRALTLTILDNASPVVAANIETTDFLLGRVTFIPGYSVIGDITVTGSFFPMIQVARSSSFTLTQTVAVIDRSDFPTVQANGGYRVFNPGLRTVGLELGGFYDATSDMRTILVNRSEVVIEINPDGSGLSLARGFFKLSSRSQSGDVGALEEESTTWVLNVPENTDPIFSWKHDGNTTLSQAIQILLAAFIDETKPLMRYLPDGEDNLGLSGTVVVTDISLSSGLDAMNEFAANFTGDGAPTFDTES